MGLSSEQSLKLSDLMLKAQEGDSAAYEELLMDVTRIVKSFLENRLKVMSAVDDVVQETLLGIHGARHTYRPENPFVPWMFAIAQHKLSDYWRRQSRVSQREVHNDIAMANYVNEAQSDQTLSDGLENALAELPDKQKQAVTLMKIEGYSVEEAAQEMGVGVSSLKVMAHRAYKTMRIKLRKETDADE